MTSDSVRTLAQNDVMNVRMAGLILGALVARGVLTASEAQALVDDVIAEAPAESALAPAFRELRFELQR